MKKKIGILLLCFALLVCGSVLLCAPKSTAAAGIDRGTIVGSNVALRREAKSNGAVICKLGNGTVVNILQLNVNAQWHKVEYNGKTGYVNRLYLSFDCSLDQYNLSYSGTVVNVKDYVTLRSTPSSKAASLGTAKKGATLTVLKQNASSGWHQVSYDGQTAYVQTKYLSVLPKVDDTQLSSLSVSGGTLSPSFSPGEYGYAVAATKSSVTIKVKANSGVKVDINGSGKSSYTLTIASGGMKTVRIKINGAIRYSLYISRNVLTLGTWNIKRGYDNLPMQGRLVNNQQPDILAIQEAYQDYTSKSIVDNLASLKTQKMPYSKFASTIDFSGGAKYGIGILSRYRISGDKIYKLQSGGFEPRVLLKTVVTINGKRVSIYNTHFTYQTAEIRAQQFAEVAQIMKKDTNKYKILFGDFNAQAEEFAPLGSSYTIINKRDTAYVDCFGNGIQNNVIDNIIVTKNIKVVNTRIVPTSLSDHDPVFAYLVLK